MKAVIFAGPSLPPSLRTALPAIDWLPPARQGELYRAALGRPAIVGVVDGYFEVTPTVWHKEILWAMAQGIHVFGAASIGALRAAELDVFGMRGVGRIYQDFRDGVLEDDDEVAVLHGPAEIGYPPVTEAMVNIRATLAEAVRGGVIAAGTAAELTAIAKGLFYKERTYQAMLDAAVASGLGAAAIARLTDWLPTGRIDQKRRDALAMLDAIRAHLAAGTPPLRVDYELADTAAWRAARRRAEAAIPNAGRSSASK
jgi:hypothetical protein